MNNVILAIVCILVTSVVGHQMALAQSTGAVAQGGVSASPMDAKAMAQKKHTATTKHGAAVKPDMMKKDRGMK